MYTGHVVLHVNRTDGTSVSVPLRDYYFPVSHAPCADVMHEVVDLSQWCVESVADVWVEFRSYWNEPCGTPLPQYQDWKLDNVIVWGDDRITPSTAVPTMTPTGPSSATLTWTAPGDDGNANRAELYNIRYAPEPIDPTDWRHAIWVRPDMVASLPIPNPPGAVETLNIDRLSSAMHFFCVLTADEVAHASGCGAGGDNSPPTISVPPTQTVSEGDTLRFTVTATDPDFDRLIMTAQQIPSDATFTDAGSGTGTFEWPTSAGDQGTYTVQFEVRDWNGATDQGTTTITVQGAPSRNGACCFPDGCCSVLLLADCSAQGGQFQGVSTACLPNPCQSGADWANHSAGNSILTITDQGILGFMDATHSHGAGFVYPKSGGPNHLYIGGLWIGAGSSYVANRDYDADPAREWRVSACPDGRIRASTVGAKEIINVRYDDGGGTQPRGLFVEQESYAFSAPASDGDYVIIRYIVSNHGPSTLTGLYLGLLADFDMGGNGMDDTAGTESGRKLAWTTDSFGTYAGVRLLDPPSGGLPMSNLTLVDKRVYVHPNQYISDADKYAFLTAADLQHVLADGPNQNDYGIVVAAGPFNLAPAETRELAYALIGGQGLSQLRAHSDAAQAMYAQIPSDVAEDTDAGRARTALLSNLPNPFGASTMLRFDLARTGPVRLEVFDVGGRLVRSLVASSTSAGRHEVVWDGADDRSNSVQSGMYFVRLEAADKRTSRRVLLLRR